MELGPKKTQKADFAMKQTNICRLSGDIKNYKCSLISLLLTSNKVLQHLYGKNGIVCPQSGFKDR